MEKEKWVSINERYIASDMGRIAKVLKPCINKQHGYKQIGMTVNGKTKTHYVHRVVLEAFSKESNSRMTVNHKDFDKTNNKLSNLEWATYLQQSSHNYENGKGLKYKSFHKNEKKIKSDFLNGNLSRKQISKKYKVPLYTVQHLLNGLSSDKAIRYKSISNEDIFKIIKLREEGVSVSKLSDQFKISKSVIWTYYRNYKKHGKVSSYTQAQNVTKTK